MTVTPQLVVCGNLMLDDIVFRDGRTAMGQAGGAALYTTLSASLWGARTAVASVKGDDYPIAAFDAMAARGVDLSGVRETPSPGLRTWLLYEDSERRVVHHRASPSHEDACPRPGQFPAHYLGAKAFHLAPMPLAVQAEIVSALASRREIAISLDPHEPIREDTLSAWRPILENIDALFVSEDEIELPGARDDPRAVLRELARGRLRLVAFKRGKLGGLLFDARSGGFLEWQAVPRLTGDPTGAGDAFAGGFLAGMVAGESLELALEQGMVSTSFALEAIGAAGLIAATADEARRRMREWMGSRP